MDGGLIQLKCILGANYNKVMISTLMGKASKLSPRVKLHYRIRPFTVTCYLHKLSENKRRGKKRK